MMLSRFAVLAASGLSVAWAARKRHRRRASGHQQDCNSMYDGLPMVLLNATTEAEHIEMSRVAEELLCTDAGEDDFLETFAICNKDAVSVLQNKFGQRAVVVEEDAGASFRHSGVAHGFSGMSSEDFFSDWRDYEARWSRIRAAVNASEGMATLEEVGRSLEGRPIYAVRIRDAEYAPGGPRLVANFQQHAREWLSGMAAVYAIEQVIANAKRDHKWLAGAELMFVPTVNPDGIVYSETENRMWRKNRRVIEGSDCIGVDINRNWGVGWTARDNYCGTSYPGTSAFSEPETEATRRVIDESFTTIHMDVHTYKQLIVVPFGYTKEPHPKRSLMDVPGKAMQQAIKDTHGVEYRYGGSELIGWSKGIARDYNGGTSGGFGYLFELRPRYRSHGGFAPPPTEIRPCVEEFSAALFAGIDWLGSQNVF